MSDIDILERLTALERRVADMEAGRVNTMPARAQRITEIVAREFGLMPEMFTIPGRKRQYIAEARFVLFLLLYKDMGISLSQVGKMFNCDHGTVLHGIKRARQVIALYSREKKRYEKLLATIKESAC